VHGFRCYDNTAPNAKCQRVLVLALCLVSRVTLEVKKEVYSEDLGDDDVDLHDVGRRQEGVRSSRRALALRQHARVAALAQVRQLVADLARNTFIWLTPRYS